MILEILILLPIAYSIFKLIQRKIAKPDFTNKTVWITGASSGIGEYLAYQFSKHGANLILSARNVKEMERVKSACSHPENIQIVKLDMMNYEQIEKVTKEVIHKLETSGKKLDIVVQNAGISMRCEFKDYSFANHVSLFDVNVHGPYRHIQCFIDHMIRNKSGHIIGITSAAGKLATTYRSSYAGTKHAFIGILDSLRSEFHQYGIKVTNIMPGYVLTNISKNAFGSGDGEKFGSTDENIKNGMKADDFSRQAVKAIYRGENELQISTQLSIPLGFLVRNICPDLFFFMIRMNGRNQSKAVKNKSN